MSGLKGDLSSLAKFQKDLRSLPTTVAIEAAAKAAPILTALVHETFNASENAYGNLWSPGADGRKVTLRKSGKLFSNVAYTATGTKIRLKLGASYAKYQVGRRPVAPRQDAPLPVAYSAALARVAVAAVKKALGR